MATTVNAHDAKTHLSRLLQRVERGEEIVIARSGNPVARLTAKPAEACLPARLVANGFSRLPTEMSHAPSAGSLPPIHGDACDRMLVAQAQVESIPILTVDPAISRYDVETIW